MTLSKEDQKMLAAALRVICDPNEAHNAVAWFLLHEAGLTREVLRECSASPKWEGPKPRFEEAPAYDSLMWKHLLKEVAAAPAPGV